MTKTDNRLQLISDDFELLLKKYNLVDMYILENGKPKDWAISIHPLYNVLLISTNDDCPCCHPQKQNGFEK